MIKNTTNRISALLLAGLLSLSSPIPLYAAEGGPGVAAAAPQAEVPVPSYDMDVSHVDADYAIEADVLLKPSSGGAAAKLAILGGSAAMAFDIVTNSQAGMTYFYRENIHHNGAGGQEYSSIGQFPAADTDESYHLMISFRRDGQGAVYLNGTLLETFWNPEMTAFSDFDMSVEACGMMDGSSVDAEFSNIAIKKGDKISAADWTLLNMDNNAGLHSDVMQYTEDGSIRIQGNLTLAQGGDWDSHYNGVSGKVYFR